MTQENKKQTGRQPMTKTDKEKRTLFLANETIENRTRRVLNPRIKRILNNLDALNNAVKSPRYAFSEEQKIKVLDSIAERYTTLESSFKGTSKKEVEDVL